MATSVQAPSVPASPSPQQVQQVVWQHPLSGPEIDTLEASIRSLAGRSLVGRMVGHSPSRSSVRDWLQSALRLPGSRIAEIELAGRGIFRVVLSDEAAAQSLLQRSPIIADSRAIHLRQWYPEFTAEDFESRFDIPRFPVTVAFPGIPLQFRHLIPSVAARMGTVVPGSLITGVGTPRLRVWAPTATVFPDIVEFLWRDSTFRQRVTVTGRPDQCLRCQAFGHLVRDCPRPARRPRQQDQALQPPRPQAQAQQQTQDQRRVTQQRPAQQQTAGTETGTWTTVTRRHHFRGSRPVDPSSSAGVQVQHPPPPAQEEPLEDEDVCLSLVPASPMEAPVPAPLPVPPSLPSFTGFGAMDTEFPALPTSTSRALVLVPTPVQAPSVGRQVSQMFMDCAPLAWRFDLASVSADEEGPLEIRVYCAHQLTLVGPDGRKAPFLSFLLPFPTQEDWSEESALSFTCSQILEHITAWAPTLAASLDLSQIAHCIGRVKWENGLCRYILPVIFRFADSWTRPLETLVWPVKSISKAAGCPLTYVRRWFASAQEFRPGGDISLLPPDSGKFDPPVSRPEAKRQRSQRI